MIEGILMNLPGFSPHLFARLVSVGIATLMLTVMAMPWAPCGYAQPTAYSSDFNDGRAEGWQLESNWQVREGRLMARGPGWARYRNGTWEDLNLSFVIDTAPTGLQASIRISDKGRYGVAFSPERGGLVVYLFRETVAAGPNAFRDLGRGRVPMRGSLRGLRVEIAAKDDTVSVTVNGKRALSVRDPEPLPAGIIGFQSLKDVPVTVDDVVVRAERPSLRVPALIGKSAAEARRQLSDVGLTVGQTRERPADLKEGLVVDQHPAEGTRAAPGTAVNLVISTGHQQVDVPRLIGTRRGEALRMIREAGLKVGGIRQADSARDDVVVIDQDPAPGVRVSSGSAVSITVAGSELVEVPRVIEKVLKNAREAIEGSRLAVGEISRKPSDATPDTVLDQHPKPGSRVPPGSPMQLWVSSGSAVDAVQVDVPTLIGHRRDEAGPILSRAKLEVGKIHERASSQEPGTIIEQDPAPNARVLSRSAVDLWVAAAANAAPPPQDGGMGWIFPAVVAGLLGLLAGYWGAKSFGSRGAPTRQPVPQITVRVLEDSGVQAMVTTSSGPELAAMHCRVIPDAGKQQMTISGTTCIDDEDTHAG